jgi:hypothetical protein
MTSRIALFMVLLGLTMSSACAQQLSLWVNSPTERAQVSEQTVVEGTVSDPKAKVWVFVHQVGMSDYWPQPGVSVQANGTWKGTIYIGRPGQSDVGKQYEIMAVANPKANLKHDSVLKGWPEAQARSPVIEVIRK